MAGFYRTCVIDGLLDHSPAEHVRRPAAPPESPTLGFAHLQFEALLTAARESADPCAFALAAMLGLLGLWIFEATSADITDLGEEHGYRVLRVCGKGTKVVLIPLPPRGRAGHRPGNRNPGRRADPAQHQRCANGPPCHHPPSALGAPACTRTCCATPFVTTMLDAGVARALVETAARSWREQRPAPRPRAELLRLAAWRASRSGIDDTLLNPVTGRPEQAAAITHMLLDHVRDALAEAGDSDTAAELLAAILARGTGATFQHDTYRRSSHLPSMAAAAATITAR